MSEIILQLENVVAGYGQMETLKGISIEVNQGEIVTIIGANGAGKTTTLNTICGIVKTRSGAIRLSNERIEKVATVDIVKRGLTQVPEGRRLFSDMTVHENLEMGAFLRKDERSIAEDLQKCFDTFPVLRERQSQMAGSLSGGEQQMCAIARALMMRPAVLLLDEPSLGLAPMIVRQIFDVIVQLNERGTTILLVEQNANMALRIAHRGYVMETGKIILSGEANDLLEDEKVKQAYLGE
jgi:branched-chain amino acid transport system ATP-binding protein